MIAQSRSFIVNELAQQLPIGELLGPTFHFAEEIPFVLVADFILVPVTIVDAINIQNPFQFPMGLSFLILLIVHAIHGRTVNVVIDWIPRLLHVKLVALVVVLVLRVLASIIIPALLQLRYVKALLLLMVLLQRQAGGRWRRL